ncbi:hypothetical protein AHF37_08510 [Paragonimus kellicotti]|nr:hypothetical protein AHF37_08510 [Paragonimus kellicotti]
MFCVVEEDVRRQSYEIYRCDDSANVHTICSFVYKAVEDPRFILQGNPTLKESVTNIRSAGMRSQTPNGASSRTPAPNGRENGNMRNLNGFNRTVSSPHVNETNDGRLSQNSSFEAVTHLISTPSRSASDNNVSDLRKRKVGRTKSVSFGTKPQAYVPVSGFSSQLDVYSYYDSPTIAEATPNEFSGRKLNRPESATGRIVIVSGLRTGSGNRRDFSAQSACVQKCEATSPILHMRSAEVQLTRASSMKNSVFMNSDDFGSRNSSRPERGMTRPCGAELEAAVMTGSPVTRHVSRCRKNLVLYAGSDSIFNRPLRAGEPIYMYVTHMARDEEDRNGSPTSTTSTVSTIRPAYVPVSGFSSQLDVYSYYDSPTIAEATPNEFSGRKLNRPESATGRIVIVSGLRTGSGNRRDFSAQSACVQKCEATSPILHMRSAEVQLTRASSMKNCAVTCNGANYYLSSGAHELRRLGSRNSSRPERGMTRPCGAELEAAVMTGSPVTRHVSRCRKNLVLYAGSDSIFNRPLRAGEPIYMYVTHMARDEEDRNGSPTSTTSTVSTIRPVRRNGRHH